MQRPAYARVTTLLTCSGCRPSTSTSGSCSGRNCSVWRGPAVCGRDQDGLQVGHAPGVHDAGLPVRAAARLARRLHHHQPGAHLRAICAVHGLVEQGACQAQLSEERLDSHPACARAQHAHKHTHQCWRACRIVQCQARCAGRVPRAHQFLVRRQAPEDPLRYPACLPPVAEENMTVLWTRRTLQVWAAYSPVKNSPADARAKVAAGNPSHSATAGELDIYQANCRCEAATEFTNTCSGRQAHLVHQVECLGCIFLIILTAAASVSTLSCVR